MIFEDIDNLPSVYGKYSKPPCPHNRHRSNMMLNPLNLKHINTIDELPADIITLNLEDAISSSRKREAMENIALFLSYCPDSASRIVVRVNPLDSGGAEEIGFLKSYGFDAVRLSKVRSVDEIRRALELLPDDKDLHISVETLEAFRDLSSWGGIPRFTMANLGILDLLADLGLPHSLIKPGNSTVEHILVRFLLDASIAGVIPVGFMYQDYNNVNEYEHWLKYMRTIGYKSSACMGPKQVDIANSMFDSDLNELRRAEYIRDLFEKKSSMGINGFMDEKYGFIDEPLYRDACNAIQKYQGVSSE